MVVGGGGWWSKGILEFHFGPNLGLRLGAGIKLNKLSRVERKNIIVTIVILQLMLCLLLKAT